MIKFRLYFNKDKATNWLNQMAQEGYAMTGFFAGFFKFEKCTPGEYSHQVDFGNGFFSINNDYREFMEENNIQVIQPWGFWVFLRKKSCDGAFQLYTDVDSSIEHYTKIRTMFKIVTILELLLFLYACYAVTDTVSTLTVIGLILLAVFTIVFIKVTVNVNSIIAKLKERKGEVSKCHSRSFSPLIGIGCLINCFVLCINNLTPLILPHALRLGLQIFAIILMVIGLYQQSQNLRN